MEILDKIIENWDYNSKDDIYSHFYKYMAINNVFFLSNVYAFYDNSDNDNVIVITDKDRNVITEIYLIEIDKFSLSKKVALFYANGYDIYLS